MGADPGRDWRRNARPAETTATAVRTALRCGNPGGPWGETQGTPLGEMGFTPCNPRGAGSALGPGRTIMHRRHGPRVSTAPARVPSGFIYDGPLLAPRRSSRAAILFFWCGGGALFAFLPRGRARPSYWAPPVTLLAPAPIDEGKLRTGAGAEATGRREKSLGWVSACGAAYHLEHIDGIMGFGLLASRISQHFSCLHLAFGRPGPPARLGNLGMGGYPWKGNAASLALAGRSQVRAPSVRQRPHGLEETCGSGLHDIANHADLA